MKKQVCMFVWNHFTNDARVLRECTALSDEGYEVDLICIDDPKDPTLEKFEERNPRFRVHRVRRYPYVLLALQRVYGIVFRNKPRALVSLLIWALLIYLVPVLVISLSVLTLLILKTKMKALLVRGSICLRMISYGWRKPYDLYHSNDLNTLFQGYICSKMRIRKKKLIYDSHEVQTSRTGYDGKKVGVIEKFFIKRMDAMIVENDTRAKYNEKMYGFYPYVVHNYPFKQTEANPDIINIHNLLGLPKNEKILLYQGGIQTGRGLEKLVQAVPFFMEGTLVFIGDGRIKPRLQQMVKEMNLDDKVKFIPKVPLEDLFKYTRNAYLGFQVLNNVCFNHYSASSNKLFEYMMCNVPVVACDFPEIKRVVEGERIGVCVDSHDFVSIAEGVNMLLNNPDQRETMKQNCTKARERYNWEQEKRRLLTVYKETVSGNKIKPALSQSA